MGSVSYIDSAISVLLHSFVTRCVQDSKVTRLLRECLGSVSCQVGMLAHVSPEPSHYSETLHTLQLASRIHRMRRRKLKVMERDCRMRLLLSIIFALLDMLRME